MMFEDFSRLSLNNQTLLIEQAYNNRKNYIDENWFTDGASWVADTASDAWDAGTSAVSDAGGWVADTASDAYDQTVKGAKKSAAWVGDVYDDYATMDTFHSAVSWLQVGLASASVVAYATGVGAGVGWVCSAIDGVIDLGYAVNAGIKGDYGEMSWRIGGAALSFLGAASMKGAKTAVTVAKAADAAADTGRVVVKGFQAADNTVKAVSTVSKLKDIAQIPGKITNVMKNVANTASATKDVMNSYKYLNMFKIPYIMNKATQLPFTNPESYIGTDPDSKDTKVVANTESPLNTPNTFRFYMQPTDSDVKQSYINDKGEDYDVNVDLNGNQQAIDSSGIKQNQYQQDLKNYTDSIQSINTTSPMDSVKTLKSGQTVINGVPVKTESTIRRRKRYAW